MGKDASYMGGCLTDFDEDHSRQRLMLDICEDCFHRKVCPGSGLWKKFENLLHEQIERRDGLPVPMELNVVPYCKLRLDERRVTISDER